MQRPQLTRKGIEYGEYIRQRDSTGAVQRWEHCVTVQLCLQLFVLNCTTELRMRRLLLHPFLLADPGY